MFRTIGASLIAISTAFSASADPLTPQQVDCYEDILRETYPDLREFDHYADTSGSGQERLHLHNGDFTNRAEIIFWNNPSSPDFTIHRYEHSSGQSATIGSSKDPHFKKLKTQGTASEAFTRPLPDLRDKIRDEDCRSNNNPSSPAFVIG